MLVAVQDEGSRYVGPALDSLRRVGAKDPFVNEHRSSYALAGYAQINKPFWVTQAQQKSHEGPSEIRIKIPLKLPRKEVSNCS